MQLQTTYEILVDELALKLWEGSDLDSIDKAELRTIAKTCYDVGGRAVYEARAFCLAFLFEYYGDYGCQSSRPTEIPQIDETEEYITLAPNPSSDLVRLSISDGWAEEPIHFTVLDINGRTVHQDLADKDNQQIELTTSNWISGFYVIHVQSGNKFESLKLIISHD